MLLDFLAAIVWPVVIVVAFLVFREPIAERISHLKEVGAGPASAKFEEAKAKTEAEVALDVVEPVAPGVGEERPDDGSAVPSDRVSLSRDELQTLVTEFAEAGWAMRDLGTFRHRPSPLIGWNEDGKPYIKVWESRTGPSKAEVIRARSDAIKAVRDRENATAELSLAQKSGDRDRIGRAELRVAEAADRAQAAIRDAAELDAQTGSFR